MVQAHQHLFLSYLSPCGVYAYVMEGVDNASVYCPHSKRAFTLEDLIPYSTP